MGWKGDCYLCMLNSSQYLNPFFIFYCQQKLLNLKTVVIDFSVEGLELVLALKVENRKGLF